jgi:hypothetical protein
MRLTDFSARQKPPAQIELAGDGCVAEYVSDSRPGGHVGCDH